MKWCLHPNISCPLDQVPFIKGVKGGYFIFDPVRVMNFWGWSVD